MPVPLNIATAQEDHKNYLQLASHINVIVNATFLRTLPHMEVNESSSHSCVLKASVVGRH